MSWRLLCIDGADAKRFFPLPESGTIVIGNSHKHADVHLNDLYVGRVHCEVSSAGGQISVVAQDDAKATLVNGQKVQSSVLQAGDVLRVGNSFLRLEQTADAGHDVEEVSGFEEVSDLEVVSDFEEVSDLEAVDGVEEVLEVAEVAEAAEVVPHGNPHGNPNGARHGNPKHDELPYLDWDELDQLTGHRLAHFDVREMLGRGFHGAVFRARNLQTRHDVALKVIAPDFPANKAELQRFAQAIKEVAKIHEDHLVRWFAAGKTGPYCWIAQELIEGESLAQILQKEEPPTKVTWRNATKLGIDLATALDVLFKRKIVHGNLVPANVLIRVTDRTVKLNDLMFADALRDSEWFTARLQGKLLAELPYFAPEQAIPGGFRDSLADIYSLGALVYARLTGRPPVQGATPGETIERIQQGKIELPKKIVKDMPDALQTVVMKMLATSQEERYQTPETLLRDLNRIYTIP